MGLNLKERRAVSEVVAKRYQKAGKKEKGKILDEFVELTGELQLCMLVALRLKECP